METKRIPLELIDPPDPPIRAIDWDGVQDLEQSIRKYGLLTPILLRPKGSRYEVSYGVHRYYAVRRIEEMKEIPAVVKTLTDFESLMLGLIENVQRVEMNPYDEGKIYSKLANDISKVTNTSQLKELSLKTGKSVSYITNRISIYENLHPELIEKIGKEITTTNAIHLSRCGKNRQIEIYRELQKTKDEVLMKTNEPILKSLGSSPIGGKPITTLYCICPVCGKKHERGI